MQKIAHKFFICSIAVVVLTVAPLQNSYAKSDNKLLMRRFNGIYEASGVQSIPDGRVIIIEDEKSSAISHILTIAPNLTVKETPLQFDDKLKKIAAKLSDLEGLAADKGGNLFAVTSHSKSKKGKLARKRERLVRFSIKENKITDYTVYKNLGAFIRRKLGVNAINIEAISFNATGNKLLIGFREPIVEGMSLIAVLENPNRIFDHDEDAIFSDQIFKLDLGGGGIRALNFDKKLNGYFIVNETKNKNGKLRSVLWFWDGHTSNTPRRIKIPNWGNIKNIEGITSVNIEGKPHLFIVSDDGKLNKEKGAHYDVLSYEQISIE